MTGCHSPKILSWQMWKLPLWFTKIEIKESRVWLTNSVPWTAWTSASGHGRYVSTPWEIWAWPACTELHLAPFPPGIIHSRAERKLLPLCPWDTALGHHISSQASFLKFEKSPHPPISVSLNQIARKGLSRGRYFSFLECYWGQAENTGHFACLL